MRKRNKFTWFSAWLVEKRKKRKNNQKEVLEQLATKGLDFIAESSGFKCIPYQFSEQYCEYIHSFDQNLQNQLKYLQLDEYNVNFKKKEIELVHIYESIHLASEYKNHIFTNSQIKSELLSQRELFQNEIKLIEKTLTVLEMREDDYEKS